MQLKDKIELSTILNKSYKNQDATSKNEEKDVVMLHFSQSQSNFLITIILWKHLLCIWFWWNWSVHVAPPYCHGLRNSHFFVIRNPKLSKLVFFFSEFRIHSRDCTNFGETLSSSGFRKTTVLEFSKKYPKYALIGGIFSERIKKILIFCKILPRSHHNGKYSEVLESDFCFRVLYIFEFFYRITADVPPSKIANYSVTLIRY